LKYLVDTNVLLSYPEFITQPDIEIVLTYSVICELDNKKYEPGTIGLASRQVSKWLDRARVEGDLASGVKTEYGNTVYVIMDQELGMPTDDCLVAVGGQLLESDVQFVLLSNDVNVRIKAALSGINASGWGSGLAHKVEYQELREILVGDDIINLFYSSLRLEPQEGWDLEKNSYVMLRSEIRENATAIGFFNGTALELITGKQGLFGLRHKNVDQMCAMDALQREKIPLVTLVGKAGSGKTLLAIAAALDALLEKRTVDKIILVRPPVPVGKDVGFLPGSIQEKMAAWAGPLYDNLDVLMKGKGKNLDVYMENGTIEVVPPTFMRGRSLNKTFVILDEGQSLTRHEMKTIATRIGDGSRLVVTGDLEQIDNPRVSSIDNGLAILVETFRGSEWAACLNLVRGERSGFASAAADLL
jgi:PhoH-like ATPase